MKLVNIEKNNDITISNNIKLFLDPDYIFLPIDKLKLCVNQNDYVYKNELVLTGNTNILSSISGKVIGINKVDNIKYIVVENDFREKTKKVNKSNGDIKIDTILKKIEEKDNYLFNIFRSLKSCENIVISAIHDEPYIINNIMLLKEQINDVLEMIDKLSLLYKSKNNMIVVKNNETDIINECLNTIGTYPNINITIVNDEYLLGRKEYLLNKLNLDVNKTLYLKVEDLVKLINYVKYNKISTTKIITICGDVIDSGQVIRVKKYTRIRDIITKYIKVIDNDYLIIANRLLNGYILNIDSIIDDNIYALYIMKNKIYRESLCINCGECNSVCPKKINVVNSYRTNKKSKECIDCGLCSYVCPSCINLRKYLLGDK